MGKNWDVYAVSTFYDDETNEGTWSREKVGTVEAASEEEAVLQFVRFSADKYGDNDLRAFPAGSAVKLSGVLDKTSTRWAAQAQRDAMSDDERDAYEGR